MHITRVLAKLEPGGAQLALLRLSRTLATRHGVTTTLLVGDATPTGLHLAERYDVPTVAFCTSPRLHPTDNRQWRLSPTFAAWLRPQIVGAEIVHAHMLGAWWAVGQVISAGTPFVATEHNEAHPPGVVMAALGAVAPRIDRFYAMGPAATRFAVAAGVRPAVIRAARSPVEGLLASPGTGPDTPRVTFAGRLAADKGPDVLLEAMALIERPDVTTYLLGEGPMRADLVARIEQLPSPGRVVLLGWVDRPWTYVAGSSVHVVPSREEAWSQSAVLALGLGVPVVGTEVDGLVHTLAHARGLTVPVDDPPALAIAIATALAGTAPVDRAGAISYARQFGNARVADFHLNEYREILGAATAPTRVPPELPAAAR